MDSLLEIDSLCAGYGSGQVLFDVSLRIGAGEAASLMGRNGMGKTTLVRCIFGLLEARKGEIRFRGQKLNGLPPERRARAGLGLAAEGRQIFPNLTVEENLLAHARKGAWDLRRVYELFAELKARRHAAGAVLSGGEQQMLAIGRALMTNPKLLVLDEATEGLAPKLRARIWQALGEVRAAGMALLVIDKHVDDLARLCDRHYIMARGQIVWQGDSAALEQAHETREKHLGI